MSFNQEVCRAFFNFNHELNSGHGIIASIYSLINRRRQLNERFFTGLELRINRATLSCYSRADFVQLLNECWNNIPEEASKWSIVAYAFFMTDMIDIAARKELDDLDYKLFREDVIQNMTLLLDIFEDLKTHFAWNLFNISENFASLKFNAKDAAIDFCTVGLFAYSFYRVYKLL